MIFVPIEQPFTRKTFWFHTQLVFQLTAEGHTIGWKILFEFLYIFKIYKISNVLSRVACFFFLSCIYLYAR